MVFSKQLAVLAVVSSMYLVGCAPQDDFKKVEKGGEVPEVEHEHHVHGPHDGHVIDLGDHVAMAEVTYDSKSHKVVVYILDHDDSSALPVKRDGVKIMLEVDGKPMELALTAVPQEGEADDVASQFEVTLEGHAAEDIHDIEEVEGSLSVNVNGKVETGELSHEHEGHDDHADHKEGDHKEEDHKDEDHKEEDHKDEDKKEAEKKPE